MKFSSMIQEYFIRLILIIFKYIKLCLREISSTITMKKILKIIPHINKWKNLAKIKSQFWPISKLNPKKKIKTKFHKKITNPRNHSNYRRKEKLIEQHLKLKKQLE